MFRMINGFIVFCQIVTVIYFFGLLTFLTDHEENKCDMTYMFEYPQYVRISNNEIDKTYPKYGLYVYSEGRVTERARKMHFDGIPVLFLPGNGGSHRQVRSMASVALRKALNSRTSFHFDYFTIDYNEELNGLNGALLEGQLTYAKQSIYRILKLYNHMKTPPTSIILFGHSMGGVIARKLVARMDSNLISIVLTLAASHKRPPLMLDSFMYDFYKDANDHTMNNNTVFVSLSGGYSDLLVPPALTEVNGQHCFSVTTTHIPFVWVPVDHLSILWCKQLTMTLNRALFASVDRTTRQIFTDINHINYIFRYYLTHNSGTNVRNASKHLIGSHGEWIEKLSRQYSVEMINGTRTVKRYMVKLIDQYKHQYLTVVALNLQAVDWIFACGAHIPHGNGRICNEGFHLSHLVEISPSALYKRKTIRLNMHEILRNDENLSHIIVRVYPTNEPVTIHFDVYNMDERTKTINLPAWWNLRCQEIIGETAEEAVSYDIILPQLYNLIQSYKLFVKPLKCSRKIHHATASLIVPWQNQNYHKHFTQLDDAPISVRLFSSRPISHANYSAKIQLTLDPTCRYRISIESSFSGQLAQTARLSLPLLVANMAAVLLMVLRCQMMNLETNGHCLNILMAIQDGVKPYYILTIVKLISKLISVIPFLPMPDWVILSKEGTDFFLLPLLLYICGVGLIWCIGIGLVFALTLFETTMHKISLKFLARTVSFNVSWSDYLMKALHKVPFIVVGGLISLSFTCGGLSLCLGAVFYFLRLTNLSQDFVEELVWRLLRKLATKMKWPKKIIVKPATNGAGEQDKKPQPETDIEIDELPVHDAIFFHVPIFLLWCLLTIINIPSVLTWAHNFHYSRMLKPDPSFWPGFLMSICAFPLWQLELPKTERKGYNVVGQVIMAFTAVCLIYAPVSIYRLNIVIVVVIMIVIGHQVFAVNREHIHEEHIPQEKPLEQAYEDIKTKLE